MADDKPTVTPSAEPLHLIENAETGDRFVLFTTTKGVELQLRFDGDEPWATRKQMADLFGVSVQNIDYHVKNILSSGELEDPEASTKESLVSGVDGRSYPSQVYNLDVILEMGQLEARYPVQAMGALY